MQKYERFCGRYMILMWFYAAHRYLLHKLVVIATFYGVVVCNVNVMYTNIGTPGMYVGVTYLARKQIMYRTKIWNSIRFVVI